MIHGQTIVIWPQQMMLIFSFGVFLGGSRPASRSRVRGQGHQAQPLWLWLSHPHLPTTPTPPAPSVTALIRMPLKGIFPACSLAQLGGSWHYITTTTTAAQGGAPYRFITQGEIKEVTKLHARKTMIVGMFESNKLEQTNNKQKHLTSSCHSDTINL